MVPLSVQLAPAKRYSVLATSVGSSGERRLQRDDAIAVRNLVLDVSLVERFDPHQRCRLERMPIDTPRGPVMTPLIGTASAIGTSATARIFSPLRFQISTSCGNSFQVSSRENGRLTRRTRMICAVRRRTLRC